MTNDKHREMTTTTTTMPLTGKNQSQKSFVLCTPQIWKRKCAENERLRGKSIRNKYSRMKQWKKTPPKIRMKDPENEKEKACKQQDSQPAVAAAVQWNVVDSVFLKTLFVFDSGSSCFFFGKSRMRAKEKNTRSTMNHHQPSTTATTIEEKVE